jgi:SpoVK/Ycf46/Vps4 family AAA+-type ATPase
MLTLVECVAEATGKALLTATMGELNQDDIPSRFEIRLKQVLQYATIWKAIVLLDEADVFLEGRSEAVGVAKEHNAFVAIFLKHLEYFSGIVFLTSNRVRVFDKAMKSRIHLALEYQPPNIDMRRRIWTHYLSAIPASELDLDVEEDVDDFLKEEVNGREIANCVNTARTLARFKGVKLQSKHVETVLETRREFEKSLRKIRERWQQTDPAKFGPFQIARKDTLETADD